MVRLLAKGVEEFHAECQGGGEERPNGKLQTKARGTREFSSIASKGVYVAFQE
jgi:hypothetical protein